MSLVLDAGAFLAVERGDRDVVALIKRELLEGLPPRTHAGVVGQVWRGGSRQAVLASILRGTAISPLDDALARRAGVLVGKARASDIVDAALALLAVDGDTLLTSDPKDLSRLLAAADLHVDVVPV